MRANEIIDCEIRNGGIHIMGYKHDGKITASCFSFNCFCGNKSFAIDGGRKEFANCHELEVFAKDVILPCIIGSMAQLPCELLDMPIEVHVCDMTIGREQPNIYR